MNFAMVFLLLMAAVGVYSTPSGIDISDNIDVSDGVSGDVEADVNGKSNFKTIWCHR